MDIVETREGDLEHRFAVTIPASDVEARVERRLGELAASLRLPGFRPGKVPLAVARERYGAATMDEITRAIARETAEQVVKERGLSPALAPIVEIAPRKPGEDLRYVLKVELMPDIPALDPAALELARPVVDDPGALGDARLSELSSAWTKRQLLDRLAEMCAFPVPPGLLRHEVAAIEKAVSETLGRESGSSATAPDADAIRTLAERRVRLGLLMATIGRRHDITEVGAALEERVVSLLLERARFTERRMSAADLLASVEE